MSCGLTVNCPGDTCNLSDLNFNTKFKKYIKGGFVGAVIPQATIANSTLQDINFSYADLSYVNFTGSTLRNINVDQADLSYAIFKDATLVGVDLKKAKSTKGANFFRTIIIESEYEDDQYNDNDFDNFEPFNPSSNIQISPQRQIGPQPRAQSLNEIVSSPSDLIDMSGIFDSEDITELINDEKSDAESNQPDQFPGVELGFSSDEDN